MPNSLRLLFTNWGRGAIEVLLFFPVLLLLTPLAGMADIFFYWLLALTLYMPLGALARLLIRSELRLIHILIGAIVVGAVSVLLFGNHFAGWSAILAGGVLYYHGFGSVRAGWHARFPVGLMWIALFIYLIAGLILPRIGLYSSYSSILGWLGVLAVPVTFIISNKTNLEEETHSGNREVRLAPGVAAKNRMLILIIFTVVVAIGLIGPIMRAFIWLKESLFGLVQKLISLFDQEEKPAPAEPTPTSAAQGGMPLPPNEGPSAFAAFMEKLFLYAGIVLAIVISLIALYFLSRLIYRVVKAIILRLLERSNDAAKGIQEYEEEKTSLMDWKELRKQYGDRLSALFSRRERDPNWESLDGSGRIRQLYQLFVRRNVNAGQPFNPHLTPREMLVHSKEGLMSKEEREQLADAYNTVRYGSRQVDEELPNRLKRNSGL